MPNIIIKSYEHVNSAFSGWDTPKGKYIKSKDHYDRTMKEQGMVSRDKVPVVSRKDYKLSEKAQAIIQSVSATKDKKGNIKLSDRAVDAMREIGAIGKKVPDYMKPPSGKGGFY